jgi:hypothetical protein
MSTPLSLSDQEMEIVTRMAEPVAFGQRREYLQAVAEALAQYPQAEIGVGTVHQVARAVQRSFVLEARRETSAGASGSKHSRPARGEATAGR